MSLIGSKAHACECGNGRIPTGAYERATKAYAKALAALPLPSGVEDDGWRPIETAPKDGTVIEAIVWVIHRPTQTGHWERDFISFDTETGAVWTDEYKGWEWDDYEFWRPSAPLPAAPKGEAT